VILNANVHIILAADPCPAPLDTKNDQATYERFGTRLNFEIGDFLYRKAHMPEMRIDELMDLWAADVMEHGRAPPFANHDDLLSWVSLVITKNYSAHNTNRCIDSISCGNVQWECMNMVYNGTEVGASRATWMDANYEFWLRNPKVVAQQILETVPIERQPYKEYRIQGMHHSIHVMSRFTEELLDNQRVYEDFMSGKWSWEEAVRWLIMLLCSLLTYWR
jgi:hypothetical protein